MTKAQIRRKIRELKDRKNQFKDRRDAVQKARNKCSDLDDYKDKIEKKINKCTDELHNGISWMSTLDAKCNTIEDNADASLLRCRGTYVSAMDRMRDEIDRCNRRMDDLDDDIRYYQYLLETAEE